jgi:hypothetical protein
MKLLADMEQTLFFLLVNFKSSNTHAVSGQKRPKASEALSDREGNRQSLREALTKVKMAAPMRR